MKPGLLHWAAAAGAAFAVHLAAFVSSGPQTWRPAAHSPGAPEVVWGLTDRALTSEVDPVRPKNAVLPARSAATLAPTPGEELRPVGEAGPTVAALPETAAPVANKTERKPADTRDQQVARPEPTPRAGGPVGRAAGTQPRAAPNAGSSDLSSYAGRVAAHLQRYKRYPNPAGQANGTATVSFSLGRGGSLQGVGLVRSSGSPVLDRAALDMVRRANPFPAMPPALRRATASFSVPIRFSR